MSHDNDLMTFGRHKGETLRSVPRAYLEWCLDCGIDNIPGGMIVVIQRFLGVPELSYAQIVASQVAKGVASQKGRKTRARKRERATRDHELSKLPPRTFDCSRYYTPERFGSPEGTAAREAIQAISELQQQAVK